LKGSGPGKTLTERAVERLLEGPAHTLELARGVLKLSGPTGVLSTAVHALLGRDCRFRVDEAGVWSWQGSPDGIPLADLSYAVVDVETTGGSFATGHRIVDLAIVPVERGQVGEVWRSLVNPGRDLPWDVQRLTGISDGMVAVAPWFEHVAPEVSARLEGRVFVGHNVAFDWRFVSTELAEAQGAVPSLPRLCTIRMARFLLPALRRRNLDALSRHYGIVNHARHQADGDALATARVFVRLLDEARARGLHDLSALERFLATGMAGLPRRRRRGRGKVRGALPPALRAGSDP
jgi:DNA polymerase III epsilon subunit family exonuclease